jgi:hypothetical protein
VQGRHHQEGRKGHLCDRALMVVKSAPEFSNIFRVLPGRQIGGLFDDNGAYHAALDGQGSRLRPNGGRAFQGPFFRQPCDRRFLRQQTQVASGKFLYQTDGDTTCEKRPALSSSSYNNSSVFVPPCFVQDGRGDIVTLGIGPL